MKTAEVKELLEYAKNNHSATSKNMIVVVNVISKREAAEIFKITSINVEGYSRVIDNSGVKHTLRKHGISNEFTRGQIPVNDEDFLLIPEIVQPENIAYSSFNKAGKQVILYEKIIGNKYYYLEEVRTGKKRLALNTMWIKKPPKSGWF